MLNQSHKAAAIPERGGKRMTRAEAARHASLVRWKKESPLAANVQERLAQIRAARVKKAKGGKGKAKGKAPKPAKPSKEQQTAQNRTAALGKLQSKPNAAAMTALDALRKGDAVDNDMAASLAEETGLVQSHADGSYSLSPAGKQFLAALDKGDAAAAHDALSGAGDKLAKQGEQAQRKADREQARAKRTAAREKRKGARAQAAKKPTAPADDKAQRQKEHDEDRAARIADRAQRQKEHAEDRARQAQERTQRAKEHADDRAQRAKDRAERTAERKRKATEKTKLPSGSVHRTAKAFEVKQTAEERAMFAAMDEKGTRKTPKNAKEKSGGGGGGNATRKPRKSRAAREREAHANIPEVPRSTYNSVGHHVPESGAIFRHGVAATFTDHTGRSGQGNVVRGDDGKHYAQRGGESFPVTNVKPVRLTQKQRNLYGGGRDAYGSGSQGAARARKGMTMDDLTPIIGDMQATIAELSEVAAPAIKAGRRNSGSDQATIDQGYELAMQLCDLFESLGADTGEEDSEAGDMPDDEMAEMKAIADDPVYYAQHECGDVQAASAALSMLAQIAASEASEQDEDTPSNLAKLRQAMQILMDFISIEVGEIKAIAARDDVNPKTGVSAYGDVQFADAKNKKYPIDTPDHIRAAWNYISKPDNAGKYAPDEVTQIKAKIVAAWKNKIDKAGPPSATKKGIELYTHDGDEVAVLPGYAIKALGDGQTGGHLIKFGGDGDLSEWRDVFDRATDYGRATKSDVYVHHRMLPGLGKRRLTNQAEIGMDDEGVFIKHLLDLRSSYERKLYDMVQAGKLGWSSGTAPHLVERKALDDGRHAILQWPLGLDASYTPMPAGGFGVEARASAMKSLLADAGIDLLHAIYDNPEAQNEQRERPDAAKALDERARRLLLRARALLLQE